jgi:hypothetical protein
MFKDAFRAIGGATRDLLKNWGALAIITALYIALLVSIYWFFAFGVATALQLVLTAVLVVLAPILFFVLHAAVANHAVGASTAREVLLRALRDSWKLFLVSLPFIALAILIYYLLNKLQAYFPVPVEDARRVIPAGASPSLHAAPPPIPMRWQTVVFSGLRLFLLGAVIPLAVTHLWIAVARDGFVSALKNVHRVLVRAFVPRSVLVYAIGLFLFGLMPYVVLFTTTQIKNAWIELFLFAVRLAFAFVLTLWGWTIAVGALARLGPGDETIPANEAAATPPREEAPAAA